MTAPKSPNPAINPAITLTFTAQELSQLEAFATLHGLTLTEFVHRAALDAAHIAPCAPSQKIAPDDSALWMSESFFGAPDEGAPDEEAAPDLFAPVDAVEAPQNGEETPPTIPTPLKRGVVGEPSQLARGKGPVWEIRRALGQERVHGLGWTREQLAFVLKLSVVGVRKMEHNGTTPIKSLEARKNLLNLAQTLQAPTPEIAAYVEAEAGAIG